jgi:hypothetical protein
MKPWILALLLGLLTACQEQTQTTDTTAESGTPDLPPPFCQDEVKYCADGQAIRRDPANNCEFAQCPPVKGCTKDLKLCENGRSVGRDPLNDCAFRSCDVPQKPDKEPMFCTQEVKQCPDGSYVGRDPHNNCSFKPCPEGRSNTH